MSVTTIPLLKDLQGAWSGLQVDLIGKGTEVIHDVYPFISITDLKRLIWIQQGGNPRWAPERVFLGVRTKTGIRPLEFHWPASVTGGKTDLPDPTPERAPNHALVDETGNRKPVTATMMGSLTVETALKHEMTKAATDVPPTLTAISLATLMPANSEDLTSALFYGYYMQYFPWLTAPGQILDAASSTVVLNDAYAAAVTYTEDRVGRISIVNEALKSGLGGTSVTMNTVIRIRWTLLDPRPESLESIFYSLKATKTIPFIRFFPAGKGAPLIKIGLDPDSGMPYVNDYKVFAQYLKQSMPPINSAVILAKIPIDTPHVRRGTAFTLFMHENGMTNVILEVPQRGMTFSSTVAADAQRKLMSVLGELGYAPDTVPILQDLHATYNWSHPELRKSAPLTAAKLQERVSVLTPFLHPIPMLPEEKALAVFLWKAVDNYENETAQFAYITQMVLRNGDQVLKDKGPAEYRTQLSKQFGITAEAADNLIEKWFERQGKAVAPVAGDLAVPKHSTGASVTIAGSHPEYSLTIHGVRSYEELNRLVSVVGILLHKSMKTAPPAPIIQAMADAVLADDAALAGVSAVDEEMDPSVALLMADLGIGQEDDDEGVEGVEGEDGEGDQVVVNLGPPAPVPDVDAEAITKECSIDPIVPGEAPIKVSVDYYMAKLKEADKVLFGYSSSAKSRVKTYSKSCQRGDGRQPNVMTLSEYASVKRCYENRVRFVDLPPNKPSDLPSYPGYDPKVRVSDDYFMTDPSGLPLWAIYRSESKETPGKFLFLICAELWCERDNLPLLRSEYEGTMGRGFAKKAMTCPFCGGAPIANMSRPASGETVVVREPKESTGKLHQYIGTITRNKHPNGYPLPCCDTTPRLLSKYMKAAAKGELLFDKKDGSADSEEKDMDVTSKDKIVDYRKCLGSMGTQYILGNDKSLEAGKIALLPPALDAFFGQNGPRSLEAKGIRTTFIPGAVLFLRVGVDTQIHNAGLNLFAGLAPLLDANSAVECRAKILSRRMIREFESANYGTLLHEFAAKSRMTDEEAEASLQSSLISEFEYTLNDVNRPHLIRLYKAWSAFRAEILNTSTPKKLRHFEHLLAEPGCITPRGLLLITLEKSGEDIQIACPSFGIPVSPVFRDVPVAFMWHDTRDESWEPIVLYNGTAEAVRFFDERSSELDIIPVHLRSALQKWLKDWRTASIGCGRPAPPPHVWTPETDTTDLPRLSNIRKRISSTIPGEAKTLIRDRSNRLAGVLFEVDDHMLFVPCLDDGYLAGDMKRLHEVDSIPLAPLDAYIKFYARISTEYRGLTITEAVFKATDKTQIVGFKTAVGTMVPTAVSPVGSSGMTEDQIDEFPWEKDALIIRSHTKSGLFRPELEESTASITEQLAEAYQYVRLTLSEWLLTKDMTLRASIIKIMASRYPLYERRKRMDILLEPLIREWVSVERTDARRSLSLLRKNCLSLPEAECGSEDGCSWSGGRCLIHVPVAHSESAGVDPVRIFTARLSDELLRYSLPKQEILHESGRSVHTIRIPRGAVRIGNELFMAAKLKESSTAILERLGFTGKAPVAFPEEMLRFKGAEDMGDDAVIPDVAPAPPPVAPDVAPALPPVIPDVAPALPPVIPDVVPATVAMDESDHVQMTAALPDSWIKKGFAIPNIPEDIEEAKQIALVEGIKYSLDLITRSLKSNRRKLKLGGDVDRPFQWSTQDFLVLTYPLLCDILFVHMNKSGKIVIDKWIKYPLGKSNSMYMIIWGRRQLLVTSSNKFRFVREELPEDLQQALDVTTPLTLEAARGSVDPIMPMDVDESDAPLVETTESSEAPKSSEPVQAVIAASEQLAAAAESVVEPFKQALGLTQTQPAA